MSKGQTLAKFTDSIPNEDSMRLEENFVAISDGAGGCGVFANEWSKYLVEKLNSKEPIENYEDLDRWVDKIWEEFYDEHERIAKKNDGIFQSKFYSEGSCATIAAIWKVSASEYKWMVYGDSVVFHYSMDTGCLEYSIESLGDFMNPPYLISCKDPLTPEGFKCGTFKTNDHSVIFVCSDALSHFVLMMYMVFNQDKYIEEIERISKEQTVTAALLNIARTIDGWTFDNVVDWLKDAVSSEYEFNKFIIGMYKKGLIDIDDYTLVFIKQ